MNKIKIDGLRFTRAQFMSAEDKRKVLRDWVRFIKGGFELKHFSKALYNHLVQHCEFIAHYNRKGFYVTYFEDPEATQRFLDQFDRSKGCLSAEYGLTYWIRDGSDASAQHYDINNAMVDSIAALLPELRKRAAQKALERAQAELKAAQDRVEKLRAQLAP